jgi:uncharacterized membrane protein YcaP (DUF421 family)
MYASMFHIELPILEKILRPIIVYLALVVFLRLFGKRELAQLNPFDLVVLLSLSNTVQNAMIGNDNSVSGGIIGALSLLTVNWALSRVLFHTPRLNQAIEGSAAILIDHGVIDHRVMKQETLTDSELLSVLHKQGVDRVEDVERCVLEPNGTFFVQSSSPSATKRDVTDLLNTVGALTREIEQMRLEMRDLRPAR